MKLQVITIGNELLNGKTKESNSYWLAKEAHFRNLDLEKIQIIGDDELQLTTAISESLKTSDVIILSGGLGPTKDDLTKKMLSTIFNCPIIENEKALELTLLHYKRFDKDYDYKNLDYQFIPKDFTPLENPRGLAPGLLYHTKKNQMIIALPGVPGEFKSMMQEYVFNLIDEHFINKKRASQHFIIKTYKLPEATLFNTTCPTLWNDLAAFGTVSSLPHSMGVDIGIHLVGTEIECEKKRDQILKIIMNSALKEYIWHIGSESLEEVIINKAIEKKITIGFAESCTGGLLGHKITNVSGSSKVFLGSIVSYANEVKQDCLNVNPNTLNEFGAVSIQVAKEMAMGARKNLKADICISTSGIAGPLGGTKEKPVGTVAIGFSDAKKSDAKIYHLRGDREELKERFAMRALFSLLERINK